MTVEIDKDGNIIIRAETPIESFALGEIILKIDADCNCIPSNIIIETDIEESNF